MGNSYQGIGRWFFPFRASDNPGPVLMTFNADEKAGKLTFEPFSNGQALSPLQAALVKGSPYARCGKVPVQHSSEQRSEEHTSELQSLMRISYAVFCLKKKKYHNPLRYTSTYSTH